MKKILFYLTALLALSACGSMPALKVHNSGPLGRQSGADGLYYNDPEEQGHNSDVIYEVTGKHSAKIIIPVKYQQVQNADLPAETAAIKQALGGYSLNDIALCSIDNCTLEEDKLTLYLSYGNYYEGGGEVYQPLEFLNPFTRLNRAGAGIKVDLYIQPAKMTLICDGKTCEVLDELGENVNSLYVRKSVTVEK